MDTVSRLYVNRLGKQSPNRCIRVCVSRMAPETHTTVCWWERVTLYLLRQIVGRVSYGVEYGGAGHKWCITQESYMVQIRSVTRSSKGEGVSRGSRSTDKPVDGDMTENPADEDEDHTVDDCTQDTSESQSGNGDSSNTLGHDVCNATTTLVKAVLQSPQRTTLADSVAKHDQFSVHGEHIADKSRHCGRRVYEVAKAQHVIDDVCFRLTVGNTILTSITYRPPSFNHELARTFFCNTYQYNPAFPIPARDYPLPDSIPFLIHTTFFVAIHQWPFSFQVNHNHIPLPQKTKRHDGAPALSSRRTCDHLDLVFPGQWIGRAGPVPWPSHPHI
ncbi:hypothetical protein PR048_015966 [Dryococelus australis]|uniref:Uncharacterized protein n=1 Tax=Dryococelus australis TaxID=614101 RepID=A0ABQ9HIR9_9NEOP|nr:hypothetical protein PR048_015966 [Dryococelus australis]